MKSVTVIDHPLVQHKLTLMRDRTSSTAGFRTLFHEVNVQSLEKHFTSGATVDAKALVALFTGAFLVFSSQWLALLRRRTQFALLRAMGVTRGSATISFAPPLTTASRKKVLMTGCVSLVFEPVTMKTSRSFISAIEFDIADEPMAMVNAATDAA